MTEEQGICTTSVSSCRDITEAVKPPRALFVNFPLGHQTGRPFEPHLQRSIVMAALKNLKTVTKGGTIADFPYQWPEGNAWQDTVFRHAEPAERR